MASRVEIIQWRDAHAPKPMEWAEAKDLECKPVIVTSCGFVVKENASGVVLALDSSDDGDFHSAGFIPKEAIISRKVLRK